MGPGKGILAGPALFNWWAQLFALVSMQPQEGRAPWLFACLGAENHTELLIPILDCTFWLLFAYKRKRKKKGEGD